MAEIGHNLHAWRHLASVPGHSISSGRFATLTVPRVLSAAASRKADGKVVPQRGRPPWYGESAGSRRYAPGLLKQINLELMIAEKMQSPEPPRHRAVNEPPWWKPMIWVGCDFFAWLRLLASNRFRIHWKCVHVVGYVTVVSFFHTLLRRVQKLVYGRRVDRTSIRKAPFSSSGTGAPGLPSCTSSWHSMNATLIRPPTNVWSPTIFC